MRAGLGPILEPLIRAHTLAGDANAALLTVTPGVHLDPRPSKQYTGTLAPMLPEVEGGKVSDLIALTAGEEVLLEVDDFLATILNDVPQVEIEGKIVEITFDDDLETGSNLFVSEVESHYRENADGTSTLLGKGNVADTLFRSFESPLDPSSFLSGGLVGSLVLSTIQDNTRYRAILRAIQASSHADVLSAPKIAVLNGHIAVIDTGSRTPVLTPTLNAVGQLQQVAVKYEDTGIKLYVTPYLLMDDMIQIDVMAEVSYVSGFIESGAAGILNPIISTRNASTVINIRDGQTFAIGGLIATDEIELVTKIPVLGDIPVLGYLFKSTNVTERQSQVIFFITPRLVRGPAPMFVPGA
ncbi:MAG: type II and III secretion system protein [Planctomycetes bacterium]|nr:type II and III secretion system protein [Planctomycetota bacterium]